MSRSVTGAFNTQLTSSVLEPFLAVNMQFSNGAVYLWTGFGDITIDGNTYTGSGTLMTVSPVKETANVTANGASVVLSGIPSDTLSVALNEDYQNRSCTIYMGCLSSGAVVADPYPIFSGLMDVMSIDEGTETVSINLSVESRLIDLEKPSNKRYTSEEQKAVYPDDLGLDFVVDLQDMPIAGGRKSTLILQNLNSI